MLITITLILIILIIGNVRPQASRIISSDGRCGIIAGLSVLCQPFTCCSQLGYCGISTEHCTTGCQAEFGQCRYLKQVEPAPASPTVSATEKCGVNSEGKKCPAGLCCSKDGLCSASPSSCGIGCQFQYGACNDQLFDNMTRTGGPGAAEVILCGRLFGKCPDGLCCNVRGVCGSSYRDCDLDAGCRKDSGACLPSKFECGPKFGDQQCGVTGWCCGVDGICGDLPEYCVSETVSSASSSMTSSDDMTMSIAIPSTTSNSNEMISTADVISSRFVDTRSPSTSPTKTIQGPSFSISDDSTKTSGALSASWSDGYLSLSKTSSQPAATRTNSVAALSTRSGDSATTENLPKTEQSTSYVVTGDLSPTTTTLTSGTYVISSKYFISSSTLMESGTSNCLSAISTSMTSTSDQILPSPVYISSPTDPAILSPTLSMSTSPPSDTAIPPPSDSFVNQNQTDRCGPSTPNDRPCSNGFCCSIWGFCGATTMHCNYPNCHSNCSDNSLAGTLPILAEPGSYCGILNNNATCPGGQCCSIHGFCGISNHHCITECAYQCRE
eukprot:Partr_v1_DN27677_c1_g1_i1_m64756 putative chitin binding